MAAQDEILSGDGLLWLDLKPCQVDEIGEQQQNDPSEGDRACMMPPQRVVSSTGRTRSHSCGPQELRALAIVEPSEADWKRLRRALPDRLMRLRELMGSDVRVAREALRKLLVGRIKFTPEGRMYRIEAESRLGPLLEAGYIEVASPRRGRLIPNLRLARAFTLASK